MLYEVITGYSLAIEREVEMAGRVRHAIEMGFEQREPGLTVVAQRLVEIEVHHHSARVEGRGDRFVQGRHGVHAHAIERGARAIGFRHDCERETVLHRLAQTLLAVGHRSHLTGQSDLAENDQSYNFV